VCSRSSSGWNGPRPPEITSDLNDPIAFYDYPEHKVHLRTTNPIETVFSTVVLRSVPRCRATPGCCGDAFKLVGCAQTRRRRITAPYVVPPIRAYDPVRPARYPLAARPPIRRTCPLLRPGTIRQHHLRGALGRQTSDRLCPR